MGEKQAAPVMVMVAVLVLAAATPTAYGQLIGSTLGLVSQLTNGVNIGGRVCCSPTGNCNGTTPGLPGAQVSIVCTTGLLNTSVTVANGTTGLNGVFNISIPNLLATIGSTPSSVLSGGVPCLAVFKLPLNQTVVCPLLNNVNGILVGVLQIVNTILGTVLGTLATVMVGLFVRITV